MKKIRKKMADASFMAKKRLSPSICCLSLLFLLIGCMDCERASISIDLIHKVAEVKFFNIVSNSKDEETIKEDFRDLIQRVYFDEASKSDPDRITSRRLFGNNEKLDGVERFAFKSLPKVLKEFGIEADKSGGYVLDVTKESESYQISGNGQLIQKGSKKFLKWQKNVKKIEFEEKSKEFKEPEKTSLLKHWLEWVDKNTKEQRTQ
jgi:hypothetical protein